MAARVVPIGERVALYRHRRGMSQVKLAALTNRSESWVSKVERGEKPVERLSVLAELARALDVPVSELAGTAPGLADRKADQHAAAQEIRLLLSEFDFLAVLLQPGRAETTPVPDLGELRSAVHRMWVLAHDSRYGEIVPLLRSTLRQGEQTARGVGGGRQREVFGILAEAYQAAAAVMAKLGETELAWVAADRSVMAAERSGMPLLALAGVFRLAHGFLSGWKLDQTERASASGALALAAQVESGPPEAVSLYGALNLVRALAASRAGRGPTAWEAIAEAERAAGLVGEDRNDFDTEFGPTNVAIHGVSIAVELGDAGEALRRAQAVHPEALSRERRARFLVEVARAHGQRRQASQTVATLRQAYGADPEQVRFQPMAQELVRDLMRRTRGHPDREVVSLARSLGLV
ncbi:MAG: helix-turn-helix transcriptional regulator [Candidatus Dormibacteraeota bacterium]|nr:helix-turn-helix transcriptional regulator [Candidatus Dormibacteraeota bacterium]